MVEPTKVANLRVRTFHHSNRFQVELPKFERQFVDGKDVVFYNVHVASGNKKWRLQKRYNHFSDLDKEMRLKHANMPPMPPKTYFPLKYDHDIEDRR